MKPDKKEKKKKRNNEDNEIWDLRFDSFTIWYLFPQWFTSSYCIYKGNQLNTNEYEAQERIK